MITVSVIVKECCVFVRETMRGMKCDKSQDCLTDFTEGRSTMDCRETLSRFDGIGEVGRGRLTNEELYN